MFHDDDPGSWSPFQIMSTFEVVHDGVVNDIRALE